MADEILNSASSDSISTQVKESQKSKESSSKSKPKADVADSRFYALYSYVAHRFQRSVHVEQSTTKTDDNSGELSVSDFLQNEAITDGDFSLTIISTNLSAEKETGLRKCLAHKITKGTVYSGAGSIIPLHLSLSEDSETYSCQMYFSLLRHSDQNTEESSDNGVNSREFLLCFLSQPEDGLDLFQKDLDQYSQGLLQLIDTECWETVRSEVKANTEQLTEINTGIRDYLVKWHDDAIRYLHDSVTTLQQAIKYLLYVAMTGSTLKLEGADEKTTALCYRFVECCSLVELLHSDQAEKHDSSPVLVDLTDCMDTSSSSQQTADEKTVVLRKDENSFSCDITELPKFCEDWAEALLGGENSTTASLKRIIESYKLKCIQDLNTLTRLIRLAETDYYALFRAFVFLKGCGNAKILLNYTQLEKQVTDSADGANVLRTLEGFLHDTGILVS